MVWSAAQGTQSPLMPYNSPDILSFLLKFCAKWRLLPDEEDFDGLSN